MIKKNLIFGHLVKIWEFDQVNNLLYIFPSSMVLNILSLVIVTNDKFYSYST